MTKKSKQARAREFNTTSRQSIKERDQNQCIFCPDGVPDGRGGMDGSGYVEHYALYSAVAWWTGNTAEWTLGCISHHMMLDNGNKGYREEMLQMFKCYLQDHYQDWSEDALVYSKWR